MYDSLRGFLVLPVCNLQPQPFHVSRKKQFHTSLEYAFRDDFVEMSGLASSIVGFYFVLNSHQYAFLDRNGPKAKV